MTVRAFACRGPDGRQGLGFVALDRVAEWPQDTQIVRVRVGNDWRCARLDRTQVVEVESPLLRDAVPSDAVDCPECTEQPASQATPAPAVPPAEALSAPARRAPPPQVQAAAISLQGVPLVVVLVRRDLVDSAGEAAMLVDQLRPRFGGVQVVLMGQDEDGTPAYHGDAALRELLAGVPVERMPWKAYPLR